MIKQTRVRKNMFGTYVYYLFFHRDFGGGSQCWSFHAESMPCQVVEYYKDGSDLPGELERSWSLDGWVFAWQEYKL